MPIESTSIKSLLTKIESSRVLLPAIQRNYEWEEAKIIQLFDSIFKNYPLGIFFIWDINDADFLTNLKFYKFKSTVNAKKDDRDYQEEAAINLIDPDFSFWAVLDGQQRMTSLLIGLSGNGRLVFRSRNGTLKYKRLYFNLLSQERFIQFNPNLDSEDYKMFRFMTDSEVSADHDNIWLKAGECLTNRWSEFAYDNFDVNTLKNYLDDWNNKHHRRLQHIIDRWDEDAGILYNYYPHLKKFVSKLNENNLTLSLVPSSQHRLEEALEIFIRINSGGVKLDPNQLLFSTIISQFSGIRQDVESLLTDVKELGFKINVIFIMRCCLYVTGSNVIFDVKSFNPRSVNDIVKYFRYEYDGVRRPGYRNIYDSILEAFRILSIALKMNDKLLKSKNAVIPIVYYLYHHRRNHAGNNFACSNNSIFEMQKFIYVSLLNKVFGNHGDSLLVQLRRSYDDNKPNEEVYDFYMNHVIAGITDYDKQLAYQITGDKIDNWLESTQDSVVFQVLSLCYGNSIDHSQRTYQIDHMHPKSRFRGAAGLLGNEDKNMINSAPNLSFITEAENSVKSDTPLLEYVNGLEIHRRNDYLDLQFIDRDKAINSPEYFALENFINFYNDRKQIMKDKLLVILSNQNDVNV